MIATALNFHRRAAKKASRQPESTGRLVQPAPDTSRIEVTEGLRKLPHRQRTALVLYYVVDLPVSEIAQVMGVTEGTVKSHLFHGRTAMREPLEVSDE